MCLGGEASPRRIVVVNGRRILNRAFGDLYANSLCSGASVGAHVEFRPDVCRVSAQPHTHAPHSPTAPLAVAMSS